MCYLHNDNVTSLLTCGAERSACWKDWTDRSRSSAAHGDCRHTFHCRTAGTSRDTVPDGSVRGQMEHKMFTKPSTESRYSADFCEGSSLGVDDVTALTTNADMLAMYPTEALTMASLAPEWADPNMSNRGFKNQSNILAGGATAGTSFGDSKCSTTLPSAVTTRMDCIGTEG